MLRLRAPRRCKTDLLRKQVAFLPEQMAHGERLEGEPWQRLTVPVSKGGSQAERKELLGHGCIIHDES